MQHDYIVPIAMFNKILQGIIVVRHLSMQIRKDLMSDKEGFTQELLIIRAAHRELKMKMSDVSEQITNLLPLPRVAKDNDTC